jgi:hypothetical protein
VLPPEDAAASPDLKNVVEQINAALPLSRTGWSLFTAGCADGSIRGNVTTGLTIVDTVEAALQNAENTLATFR